MKQITFPTTHWSVVLAAKWDDTKARAAMCESCREPILRYVERVVRTDSTYRYGGRNAEDLTHDFLARLLEGKMFAQMQRDGAPFRVYLIGAVRYFLSELCRREAAEKRGGGASPIALTDDSPEPQGIDANTFDDAVFDREWALAMIQRAMRSLELASEEACNLSVKRLLPWITQEMTIETRTNIAAELGMSDAAVKVALHRLRKKFRETIRSQIAVTVKDASEIDGELEHLIRALKAGH